MATAEELKGMAEEILANAEANGVESNYLFVTTFDRYETQLKVLEKLKETISKADILVTKEYVKGRENIYTNPAVSEYNRTTDSANKTVSTLMKIIKNLGNDKNKEESDPLMNMINGGGSGD
jgi:hypothetical protein